MHIYQKKNSRKGSYHKADFELPNKEKGVRTICSYSFSHALPARYSVLHLFGVLSGGNIAFLREEGGTRSVTEGARVTLVFNKFYRNALSLTRLRRELPPGGSLWFVRPESLSAFLDKHCICRHKSEAPRKAGQNNLFRILIQFLNN